MSSKLESDVCCRLQVAPPGERYGGNRRPGRKQRQTTAEYSKWRDSLHVTCGLTACTPGSAPGPTLGNEYGKNFTKLFTLVLNVVLLCVFAINRFVDISYFHSPVCTVYSVCDYYRPITDTAGIVCGPGSMKRSRVRLSVCLSARLYVPSFDIRYIYFCATDNRVSTYGSWGSCQG